MTKRPKEAKYNDIVGWCPETTTTNLLKTMQHDKKGGLKRPLRGRRWLLHGRFIKGGGGGGGLTERVQLQNGGGGGGGGMKPSAHYVSAFLQKKLHLVFMYRFTSPAPDNSSTS